MPTYAKLRLNRDFARVYRHGQHRAGRWLLAHRLWRQGKHRSGPVRVGIAVARKTKGAVRRNRMKRVLRETMRRASWQLADHADLIVTARWGAEEPSAEELARELYRLLSELKVVQLPAKTDESRDKTVDGS